MNRPAYVAYNFNCGIKTEELLKVIVMYTVKVVNISETVQQGRCCYKPLLI